MSYKEDNRWSPGASNAPEVDIQQARAAYSGRWLDRGHVEADVLGDRQGFAYDDPADRDELIASMTATGTDLRETAALPRDETVRTEHPGFICWRRRSGGYVYVDCVTTP